MYELPQNYIKYNLLMSKPIQFSLFNINIPISLSIQDDKVNVSKILNGRKETCSVYIRTL